ncbi:MULTISPECIES: hypothetical protein [Streptomyces]|uniref:hypothetical protein n=1 Tax=Streptomyces TaxID=1883 RepID=UPI00081E0E04|nr:MULTISPECIES: hypothetical protein [unclassified Streptomyces]MYQ93971.1 hypothetical protein [Streptomyces sp. SID4946]SCF75105.1 hypothetical protein GA0115258_1112196 [Streptomyces sp. LamerLS-31b]SCF85768.1 hypothetical protein GA0115256_124758 [Streptomyces sp. DconLS]
MFRSIVRGCAAGAAGTTALNALSYLDMALRGRPSSSAPEDVVEKITEKAGHPVPESDGRDNRLAGLGALTGIAVGVGTGAAVALLYRAGVRPPGRLGGPATGALAMVLTDTPIAGLGISDPRTWSPADWTADALPHLGYGLVTYGLISAAHRHH